MLRALLHSAPGLRASKTIEMRLGPSCTSVRALTSAPSRKAAKPHRESKSRVADSLIGWSHEQRCRFFDRFQIELCNPSIRVTDLTHREGGHNLKVKCFITHSSTSTQVHKKVLTICQVRNSPSLRYAQIGASLSASNWKLSPCCCVSDIMVRTPVPKHARHG